MQIRAGSSEGTHAHCVFHACPINVVLYVFTVLPFGLSSAPYVFTKVLKPLEKYWRIQGLCIAIFWDDGWAIV